MNSASHWQFDRAALSPQRAHEGRGLIETARVYEGHLADAYDFIDVTRLPPRTSIGAHTHSESDSEVYVVLAGEGEMLLDGEVFAVSIGSVVMNRPGGSHALRNLSETETLDVVVLQAKVPRCRPPIE